MTNSILTHEHIVNFQTKIWDYFNQQGRDFPWRKTTDPYAIMVSEFMLQQTQTMRVCQKYEVWLDRFPTVQSVADATLADVLSMWNGLGYNRRAKFLHKTCQNICLYYDGLVPCDAKELDALPGIGAYTARAICTFAFNKPEVFIETNIRSVFIKHFFTQQQPDDNHLGNTLISDADILALVEQTLDRQNPRNWYYALMDYGAFIKKSEENPSRKSRSYSKQSTFKGSLRQARGAILRQLSRQEKTGISLEEIAAKENIDMERLDKAADYLTKENMIYSSNGQYFFSEK